MIEFMFSVTRRALVALICLAVISPPASAGAVKLGILKFGTVSWEADVIKQHGLDKAEGIDLQTVELANNDAAAIALQAGSVDIIVTDWVWVSRERADGSPLTFVPYSTSIGSLMLPGDSAITNLLGLEGRKLGIAGGPTDKSWLILRALSEQRHGFDLADKVEKVFAAPPLLNEELVSHHLDAVLIYWNYAAQLMVVEKSDPEEPLPLSPTRVRLLLDPDQIAGLDSEEGQSVNLTCTDGGKVLVVDVGERDRLVELQDHALQKAIALSQ
jgi:NitT/TauT family transport system substrate-binding protein